MVNEQLRLKLVESGYGREFTPLGSRQEAAGYIKNLMDHILRAQNSTFSDGEHYDLESHMVLFDGPTRVIVDSGRTSRHESPAIAFTTSKKNNDKRVPSLGIHTLEDLMNTDIAIGVSELIPLHPDYSADIDVIEEGIKCQLISQKTLLWLKYGKILHDGIHVYPFKGTSFHVNRIPNSERNDNLWEYIGTQMNLDLKKEKRSYKADVNGLSLRFKDGLITVTFPQIMERDFLEGLIEGLKSIPQSVDGNNFKKNDVPYIQSGGKVFEVNVDPSAQGYFGQTAIHYLSRLLERTGKPPVSVQR